MIERQNPKSEIRNPKPDVDKLLRSFFRSEMPQPWPVFSESKIEDRGSRIDKLGVDVIPQSSTFHPPSSILHPRSSRRSRLVLAASMALLLISSWWIGQKLSTHEPSVSPASNGNGKMIGARPGKSSRTIHVR
jgi:hypothetical protein